MSARWKRLGLLLMVAFLLVACGAPEPATPTSTPELTATTVPTATPEPTETATSAPTETPVPLPTVEPTATVEPTVTPIPGERQEARVVRVVDGDTIVVEM